MLGINSAIKYTTKIPLDYITVQMFTLALPDDNRFMHEIVSKQ
jgi:hypothetical protein